MSSIDDLIFLGLTAHLWDRLGEIDILRNSTGNFTFTNNTFVSFGEDVAIKYLDDGIYKLKILMKTAKYDNFVSSHTTSHINRIIFQVLKHPYFKHHYTLRDKFDNVITKNIDKGTKTKRDFNCPICLDDFTTGNLLKCSHIFCKKCILTWLQKNKQCPYCRKSTYY
tara:strand:- start:487 stop:987 length:501 start_codon:yes stop_codon:yes gene_type:complete